MLFVDPFGASYFTEALRAAQELAHAPTLGTVDEFDIVKKLDGPHTTIEVARRGDGTLLALKSFRADTPVTVLWLETRQNEALRMILHGHGGLLPITQTLNYGGVMRHLCMPFCQGGSLRDRMAAGSLTVTELAYHGLALACAMSALHAAGKIHGDIKPENILFGHFADDIGVEPVRWRTYLSDLETMAPVGQPTSWRMTPAYAAPEQLAGADAAPAMDVWAWGATMRECLGIARGFEEDWQWLLDLIEGAMSAVPEHRPPAEEIIETFGRHIGFGNPAGAGLIGAGNEASAHYPHGSVPDPLESWDRHDAHLVTVEVGWAAWLVECRHLSEVHSVPALLRIEELCGRVLGDPSDPGSTWNALHADRSAPTVSAGIDAGLTIRSGSTAGTPIRTMPRDIALTYVRTLLTALVELVEETGAQPHVTRLRSVASAWESLGEFGDHVDAAILAQAWLILDDLQPALPHLRRSFNADRSDPSARAAMHLYYRLAGDFRMAAKVALQPEFAQDETRAMLWLNMAMGDLLEAGDHKSLDEILKRVPYGVVDSFELIRAVHAGRRGPVRPDPMWLRLRDHYSSTADDGSILAVRYLVEAAFQRGDIDFARRRAAVARTHPATRMPVNHLNRAAIEAIALGRDPAQRGLTPRLNNRAELWSADSRPDDDLLSGIGLIAARRWVSGADSAELSSAARDLVRRSEELLAQSAESTAYSVRHCAGCREPGRVEDVSVCGACRRVYCPRCVEGAEYSRECPCSGDLAHPPQHPAKPASRYPEDQIGHSVDPQTMRPVGAESHQAAENGRRAPHERRSSIGPHLVNPPRGVQLGNGNNILLDRSRPIAERLKEAASLWSSAEPADKALWFTHGKAFFMAYCWFIADESRVAPAVRDYVEENYQAGGGTAGWDRVLRERLECSWCREAYKAENMGICVGCAEYVCFRCESRHSRASCEIVG